MSLLDFRADEISIRQQAQLNFAVESFRFCLLVAVFVVAVNVAVLSLARAGVRGWDCQARAL